MPVRSYAARLHTPHGEDPRFQAVSVGQLSDLRNIDDGSYTPTMVPWRVCGDVSLGFRFTFMKYIGKIVKCDDL
jgi:hypothetical protein